MFCVIYGSQMCYKKPQKKHSQWKFSLVRFSEKALKAEVFQRKSPASRDRDQDHIISILSRSNEAKWAKTSVREEFPQRSDNKNVASMKRKKIFNAKKIVSSRHVFSLAGFSFHFSFFGTSSRRRWVTCTRSRKAAINSARSVSTHKFVGRRGVNDASGEITSLVNAQVLLIFSVLASLEITRNMAQDVVMISRRQRQVSTDNLTILTNLFEVGLQRKTCRQTIATMLLR